MEKGRMVEILKSCYRWGQDNGSNRSDKNFNDFLETSQAMEMLEQGKQPQSEENNKSMIQFVLDIDFLTTTEFCKQYNIPEPIFTGEIQSSAAQFLRIDAIKHKMFVEYAKKLTKEQPRSERSAESIEMEMFLNMQYYYEYCVLNGYVTPQKWLNDLKHFK